MARINELWEELNVNVGKYNEAYQAGEFDKSQLIAAQIDKDLTEFNTLTYKAFVAEIAAAEDPMLKAVQLMEYPAARVKEEKLDSEISAIKTSVYSLEMVDKPIKLRKLHKDVAGGIGKDKNWIYMAERFNLLMAARVAGDVAGLKLNDISDSYAMKEISRKIDMGQTPTSNTKMLQALTKLVAAMIGPEYQPNMHDVKAIEWTYAKSKGGLKVACSKHDGLVNMLMQVCHRIVTNGVWAVEYQTKKK